MNKIKVKNYKNLYRDEDSGAIINTDDTAYNLYVSSKRNRKIVQDLKNKEIEDLKSEISELRSLVMELLNEPR